MPRLIGRESIMLFLILQSPSSASLRRTPLGDVGRVQAKILTWSPAPQRASKFLCCPIELLVVKNVLTISGNGRLSQPPSCAMSSAQTLRFNNLPKCFGTNWNTKCRLRSLSFVDVWRRIAFLLMACLCGRLCYMERSTVHETQAQRRTKFPERTCGWIKPQRFP